MSVDPEGVIDLEQSSPLAVAAALIAFIGLLAIVEPYLYVVGLVALLLGLIVLTFSNQWQLSKLSLAFAKVAVILGAFAAAAGMSQKIYKESVHQAKAISLAQSYMDALARGDRNMAIKLVGLPQPMDEGGTGKVSREQQAVQNFLHDKPIQEVLSRGEKSIWKANGVLSSHYASGVIERRIAFIDANETNQIPFIVTVKMLEPQKYSVETKTRWIVDGLDHGNDFSLASTSLTSKTLVSLGANLGDAEQTICIAASALSNHFGSNFVRFSRLFQTEAIGGPDGQDNFYNAVAVIESEHTAFEVWQFLNETEQSLGRYRQKRWEARRIDLDVLLHNQDRIWTPTFKVPHPRMTMRTFVLAPACDVCPDWVEPVTGQRITDLSARLDSIAHANPSSTILVTSDNPGILESLANAVIKADCLSNIRKAVSNASLKIYHQDNIITYVISHGPFPWMVIAPTELLSKRDQKQKSLLTIIGELYPHLSELLALNTGSSPNFEFGLWMHACRSPDPTSIHWEDFCRPWAKVFGIVGETMQATIEHSVNPIPTLQLGSVSRNFHDSMIGTPKYLLPADNLDWAVHEILAASDAMRCPIQPCGVLPKSFQL